MASVSLAEIPATHSQFIRIFALFFETMGLTGIDGKH